MPEVDNRISRALLITEAGWWLMRPFFYSTPVLLTAAGWYSSTKEGLVWRLVLICIAAGLARGATGILNDILDRETDRISAPDLPIPSGLISVAQAFLALIATLVITVVAGLFACGSILNALAVLGLFVAASMLTYVYSKIKAVGRFSLPVATAPFVSLPIAGWIVAGHSNGLRVMSATIFALCYGLNTQLIAALRDIDRDPAAGVTTVAVEYGPYATLRASAVVTVAEIGILIALIAIRGDQEAPSFWAFVPLAVGGLLVVSAYPQTHASFKALDLSRNDRTDALADYTKAHFWFLIALVMAFNPLGGIAIGSALFLLNRINQSAYERRILSGTLRRSLSRHRG